MVVIMSYLCKKLRRSDIIKSQDEFDYIKHIIQMNLEGMRIAVIGLGYVGLPLAIEFSKKYKVLGFDINQNRVNELNEGRDHTLEADIDAMVAAMNARKVSDD